MKGGNWEREGGDLWDLVLAKVLVKTEVCQVRDEEGIFLVPPTIAPTRQVLLGVVWAAET
jgi:hypothetical protein